MKLHDIVKTGDLLFVNGNSLVSRIIKKITTGEVNHVGVVYDKDTIFETGLSWGKAEKHKLDKYDNKKIIVVRMRKLEDREKIQELCDKYSGTPYSIIDIITNIIFSPFNDTIREKFVKTLGTKKFMICSEMSAKILYETTGYKPFKDYEGLTPQDILTKVRLDWRQWETIVHRLS